MGLLDKLTFYKNNNNKPVFDKINDNNKVNKFDINGDNIKYTKKSKN